jgi:aminopeptidase-like protein
MSDIARDLYTHVEALFPICRSITGEGLRQTLHYIADQIPLQVHEVPSGTPVLDWEVPPEWTVRGASIRTVTGRTVVDFAHHNLHLLQYSRPVDRVVGIDELQRHLHSLPEQPELIPYRTAYYAETWGFCLAHRDRLKLIDPAYHVRVDTEIAPGSLSYGECFLPGEEAGEVLLSVHCCHPSLANDNLSGIAVAIELAHALANQRRRFGYRFVFVPGTIGAITWLHFNRDAPSRVCHGLVLTCLGDAAPPTYKQSRRGTAPIDRYAAYVLREEGYGDRVMPFVPYGYDERQYCSPGFDLPVGCLMRSPNGTFPEYHTSADNLSFVKPEALADSLRVLERLLAIAERDTLPRNLQPYGEPQLGRRGLYRAIGGQHDSGEGAAGFDQLTLLWVLNLADGKHSLLDMAQRSGKPFETVAAAADALDAAGLLVV